MNSAEMIALRSRSPFAPFELRLKDGTSIRVEHSYEVATGRDSPECAIYVGDDRVRFVAYRDITAVVPVPVNGS